MKRFIASEKDTRKRLDVYLAEQAPQESRNQLQKWIEAGSVAVNGLPAKPGYRLKAGDRIDLNPHVPEPLSLEPEPIPLVILWEDPHLLVIDKPPGLVVHPAPGHAAGTLVHALLHHCRDLSGIGGVLRPGIVHRLDKDTSGLLAVAKDDRSHRNLIAQFQHGSVAKQYRALVWGHPPRASGCIDRPIGRHPVNRKKMAVTETRGKPAVTEWEVRERYPAGLSRLRVRIRTGRTHQIRVHLAFIGYPILGDPLYGPRRGRKGDFGAAGSAGREWAGRQMLHAETLSFDHPRTGERLSFHAPPPPDMVRVLEALKKS